MNKHVLGLVPAGVLAAVMLTAPVAAQEGCAVLEATLMASDATPEDLFGTRVGIDGDTVVVGARNAGNFGTEFGAAYVFERLGDGTWIQTAKLESPTPSHMGRFGVGAAIQGDTIVVGEDSDDLGCGQINCNFGSAHIFTRQEDGSWLLVQTLTSPAPSVQDQFGINVAIDGDWLMVSAPGEGAPPLPAGAIHAFRWNGSEWVHAQTILAADPAGHSLGVLSLQRALLLGWSSSGLKVFRLIEDTWMEETLPVVPGHAINNASSAAVSAGRILAGFDADQNDLGVTTGAVYVFEHDGDAWHVVQCLAPEGGKAGDKFGSGVAASGERAIVGAVGAGEFGLVWVLERIEGTWTFVGTIENPTTSDNGGFGSGSMALQCTSVVVARSQADDVHPNAGTAHVFDICGCSAGPCPADCNGDGEVNIFDFLCFQGLVSKGDPAADCNGDGVINIFDFLCFQGLVSQGCP
jgi:hypothetical protein